MHVIAGDVVGVHRDGGKVYDEIFRAAFPDLADTTIVNSIHLDLLPPGRETTLFFPSQ